MGTLEGRCTGKKRTNRWGELGEELQTIPLLARESDAVRQMGGGQDNYCKIVAFAVECRHRSSLPPLTVGKAWCTRPYNVCFNRSAAATRPSHWSYEASDRKNRTVRESQHEGCRQQCPKVCYRLLVTSNNLTAPHAKVARHSQNTVSSESTQIWFPFDHSLTSSTEVLAKRLIGTCA